MLCIPIIGPTYEAARNQIQSALKYADLIELRLDYFTEIYELELKQLRSAFSIPMIFTLRDQSQGGHYAHSESRRHKDLLRLANLKPEYMDIESHVPSEFVKELSRQHPEIKVIISYHDFEKTPHNLIEIYQSMQISLGCFYKMAFKAESSIDALRVLEFRKQSDDKLIAMSMGLDGQLTRILGPIVGNAITYACLNETMETAPGQIDARTLVEKFRFKSLNRKTSIYALIGYPLDSFGDIVHNALMKEQGMNAVYLKIGLQANELFSFFQYAKQFGFQGLSVTMPIKENVIPFIDDIDSDAMEMGAVNTIHFNGGKVYGYNTDGNGALNAIEKRGGVKDKRLVIIGAGGTAKAIGYIAHKRGAHITILNRDKEKARIVAEHFQGVGMGLDDLKHCFESGYDVLINTTPIPMPINHDFIREKAVVMDVDIANRLKATEFLQHACEKGCSVVFGYEMWIEQALNQCWIWYGKEVNLDAARKSFEAQIESL